MRTGWWSALLTGTNRMFGRVTDSAKAPMTESNRGRGNHSANGRINLCTRKGVLNQGPFLLFFFLQRENLIKVLHCELVIRWISLRRHFLQRRPIGGDRLFEFCRPALPLPEPQERVAETHLRP